MSHSLVHRQVQNPDTPHKAACYTYMRYMRWLCTIKSQTLGIFIIRSLVITEVTSILYRKVTSRPCEVTLDPLCRVVPSTPQSHLVCIFSPCIHILTLHTYSHLTCPHPPFKVTSHTHSHLVYTFSPRVHILTLHAPSTIQSHLIPISSTHSHLAYIYSPCVLPSTQNNKIPKKVMQQPQFHQ